MGGMDPAEALARLRPGVRAVVRHREGTALTDAVGQVEALDEHAVTIGTRTGRRVIALADVLLAKQVPPRPSRRGAAHRALSVADLERLMVEGWPPLERAQLGEWLLRAGRGYAGRANSALLLGDPGVPLLEALARVERWYDERGLRRLFALPAKAPGRGAVEGVPDSPAVSSAATRALLDRGYTAFGPTLVMTAATRTVLAAAAAASTAVTGQGVRIEVEASPSESWWEVLEERRPFDREVARAVLTGSPEQVFATAVEADGSVLGIGRAAFAHQWAGVFAVSVRPGARRRGLATAMTGALAGEARARGIASMYLQVTRANDAGRAAYEELGFSVHHEYCYLGA
jgi:N-acetylglutamate synthase